jgi:enamine deaminase RidA (YjgF/YER057c/UK114 family)
MKLLFALLAAAGVIAGASAAPAAVKTEPVMQRIARQDKPGCAASVRVPDAPLIFTGLVFAAEPGGEAAAEAAQALEALGAVLARSGGALDRMVRLNAYVTGSAVVSVVDALVAERFGRTPVAYTLVRTPLARAGARVAFEAVAQSSRSPKSVEVAVDAAVLPAGGKIFISGQAEKGTDVASAVKLTMAGLHRSLAHLGLKKSDVVQVKAFLAPFADHVVAAREIAASFDGGPVPPAVLLEWVSELHTEIELVAAAPGLPVKPGENITYSWLPWLVKSPRYCNVAHVAPGTPLIFVGAVDGGDQADPRTQMKVIFERLGSVLFEAGSSFRNLAKATYYLNDATARTLLGDIRGVYFDPTRPPAASALNVNGLGRAGRAAMIDLVAVPVK